MSTLNAKTFNQVHWNWPGIVFVAPRIVPLCILAVWPSYGVAGFFPVYRLSGVWPTYDFSIDADC